MKLFRGKLKCPMILVWICFAIQIIYLVIIYCLKKYISFLYLILDVEILFNIEITSLFITISNYKDNNNYIYFIISLILSIINVPVILYSLFIVIFAFFKKDLWGNFIKSEPWVEIDGITWMGILFIIEKIIGIIPFIILLIYLKNGGNSVGKINQRLTSINEGEIIGVKEEDEDKLI